MFRRGPHNTYRTTGRLSQGRDLGPRLSGQRINPRPEQRERQRQAILGGLGLGLGLVGRLCGLALLMLISGALLLGGYLLLSTSRAFAVSEAQVIGTDNLSRLEILRAAGIGSDSNLWSLPMGRIQSRILAVPWVAQATVERRWPNTVRIQVSERRPAMLALVEGQLYYLDAQLRPFTPVKSDETLDLPVLSGLSKADLIEPDQEMGELLAAVRDLRGRLDREPFTATRRLSEVHLDRVWGVSLVLDDLTPTVRLGWGDFSPRLGRLGRVAADLKARGELARALLIDLDSDRRAVVRLGREGA